MFRTAGQAASAAASSRANSISRGQLQAVNKPVQELSFYSHQQPSGSCQANRQPDQALSKEARAPTATIHSGDISSCNKCSQVAGL